MIPPYPNPSLKLYEGDEWVKDPSKVFEMYVQSLTTLKFTYSFLFVTGCDFLSYFDLKGSLIFRWMNISRTHGVSHSVTE